MRWRKIGVDFCHFEALFEGFSEVNRTRKGGGCMPRGLQMLDLACVSFREVLRSQLQHDRFMILREISKPLRTEVFQAPEATKNPCKTRRNQVFRY